MAISNRIKNQHLLWRAAFGPMIEGLIDLDTITPINLWKLLQTTSAQLPTSMDIATNPRKDKAFAGADGEAMNMQKMDAITKKLLAVQYRADLKTMNVAWLNSMINSKAQLREKLTFFWHGHFACRTRNAYFGQELYNIIKVHALGNFADMLIAVSKSPAMLQFLNNQENRKGHPNENFAREVMELFTLGRGNYTEQDVKEAARAFTGWSFNKSGEFAFKQAVHDTDTKNILGQQGNFNGDDVLSILLKKPETAYFICKKIYRFFVNDKVDEKNVQWLAERFLKNKYNISSLLTDIFTSEWFFEKQNIGVKIKSPIELLVGIRRYIPLELDNDDVQLLYQKVLGQILFYPPNVAGWPGGSSWIDSSTLMLRLQMPQALSSNDAIEIKAKADDDTDMGMGEEKQVRIGKNKAFGQAGISATIDWAIIIKQFEKTTRTQLSSAIINTLLQTEGRVQPTVLQPFFNNSDREAYIKSIIINVMSTPEYQLC